MMTAKGDKRRGVVHVTCDFAHLDLSAFFAIQKTNPFVEKHILWQHRQLITGYWSRSSPVVCLFKVVIESLNSKAYFLHLLSSSSSTINSILNAPVKSLLLRGKRIENTAGIKNVIWNVNHDKKGEQSTFKIKQEAWLQYVNCGIFVIQ